MKKNIEKQYSKMADSYEQTIRKLIPKYDHVMKKMVKLLPFDKNQAVDVLDVGCGTGNLSLLIKKKYYFSKIICLDPTAKMLKCAKEKLSEYDGIEFEKSLVQEFNFKEYFDAVVVSMVFQNLTSKKQKLAVYKKIFKSLKQDGLFLLFGPVLGESEYMEEYYMREWSKFMYKHFSKEKTDRDWIANYKEKDGPNKMSDELEMLYKSGFKSVDIAYKNNNLALLVCMA